MTKTSSVLRMTKPGACKILRGYSVCDYLATSIYSNQIFIALSYSVHFWRTNNADRIFWILSLGCYLGLWSVLEIVYYLVALIPCHCHYLHQGIQYAKSRKDGVVIKQKRTWWYISEAQTTIIKRFCETKWSNRHRKSCKWYDYA